MRTWHVGAAAALALTAALTGALGQPAARAQDEVRWLSDYESARGIARESDKPLFVAFR